MIKKCQQVKMGKVAQKNPHRILTSIITPIFALVFIFWFLGTGGESVNAISISPKDFVMSEQEAISYAQTVLSPILVASANNKKEIPGIRNRLIRLAEMVKKDPSFYRAIPAYHPKSRTLLAHIDFDVRTSEPVLQVFIPAFQDLQRNLSANDFKDAVIVVYAHEIIHVESKEFSLKDRVDRSFDWETAREEAIAWGITILEMTRPMEAEGRFILPKVRILSQRLRQLNDNYRSPEWTKLFLE